MSKNVAESATRLSDHVYSRLADEIRSGRYAEDVKLASELEMSRRFQVSRPILRQALTQLKAEGMISSRKGSGWYVARRTTPGPFDFGQLRNVDDVRRCLEFRRGIEGEAAKLAAQERTDAQVAEMKRTIREIRRAVEQGGDGIDEDFSFHLAVAQGTQNRFFVVALEGLRSQINLGIQLIRNLSTEPAALHLDIIESEHAEILNAIENQDAEQAVMTMVSHLSKGINRVFSTVS